MNFRFRAAHGEKASGGGPKIEDAKPKLEKLPLPKEIIDEEKIDGFLTAMCNVDEARKLVGLPDIAFYNRTTNSYSTVNIPKLLTEDSLHQVRITMEDGSNRYFKMIDHLPGGNFASGLKATAYVETDENGKFIEKDGGVDLRLNFAGYTSPLDGPQLLATLKDGENLTSKLLRVAYDSFVSPEKANKRSLETVEFVHNIIDHWKKRGDGLKVRHIIYGSHSMGAGNALVAQAISDIEGIPTKTTLAIEQVKAREQADRVKAALSDTNSSLYKKIMDVLSSSYEADKLKERIAAEPDKLEQEIKCNAISIHAFTFKKNGDHKASISTVVNNKERFGKEVLQDVGEALQSTREQKHSEEKKPPQPLINLWAEHKLKALLQTAKSGNYYNLNSSKSRELPEVITEIAIAPDTEPSTAMFAR